MSAYIPEDVCQAEAFPTGLAAEQRTGIQSARAIAASDDVNDFISLLLGMGFRGGLAHELWAFDVQIEEEMKKKWGKKKWG
jgi:hypothetical protein